jgi:hypothetical protein
MKLFQDHEGERVNIQFTQKDLDLRGYIMGIENDCIKISHSPDGKGTIRYMPWPNLNVAFIEFLPAEQTGGGTEYLRTW